MVPTPLQAFPLSHRLVLGWHTTVPLGLGAPPQQVLVDVQKSPVSRQPPTG
jgi:hypothetical protein